MFRLISSCQKEVGSAHAAHILVAILAIHTWSLTLKIDYAVDTALGRWLLLVMCGFINFAKFPTQFV
jgi:hypothetical protein